MDATDLIKNKSDVSICGKFHVGDEVKSLRTGSVFVIAGFYCGADCVYTEDRRSYRVDELVLA